MKKLLLFSLAFLCVCSLIRAQDSTKLSVPKIALFAPIYPKFINPGLEFYEGAQLALDSLATAGVELEVYVYDTRSARETLNQQLQRAAADSIDILLAHCTSQEVKTFADFALRHAHHQRSVGRVLIDGEESFHLLHRLHDGRDALLFRCRR